LSWRNGNEKLAIATIPHAFSGMAKWNYGFACRFFDLRTGFGARNSFTERSICNFAGSTRTDWPEFRE
jgi:hypothetical protein